MLRISLACCLLCFPALTAAAGFEAGAARVDITPEEPVRLSGYGARTTVHEGVEDPIFARALALRDEAGVISVLVSVDAIGIPASLRERVVGSIRGRTGVYHVRLAIAATHSHYAPVLQGSLPNIFEMTPAETAAARRYTDLVVKRIVQAIDQALGRLAPATVSHAKGSASFAANRRTPGGPTDHDVPVLAVRDGAGKPMAIAFGYACHATTMQANVNRVSGDWPGHAAAAIEAAFPGAVALPVIGCGGDQNPQPRGTLALSQQYGADLAAEVTRLARGDMKLLPPRLDAHFEYVPLRFARVPTAAELRERLERGPAHVQRLARTLLARLESGQGIAETYPYSIQVWSFGEDLWWVFLAGEVVVDYAHRLRRELGPREAWIVAYANDAPGYISSRRVLAEGGYEAEDSMVWYGQPSRWDDSIEEAIVEKVKALAPRGDVAGRLRPPPPREPREALALFRTAPGIHVELAAAEPEVTDPVQIAFDEDGRLHVAEMRDYPLGPGEGKPFDGRVRVLEDRDLDGYYEHSRILAEDVPYANGIACSRGGVFVAAVPTILYLKDEDGDGRAEIRRTVYSGFRPGNSQHLLNSLEHGPDNWIHSGGGDAATVRWVDAPVPAPAGWQRPDPLPLLHSNFRFHPRTLALEPTSGYRGGFGIAFDERGSRFVCDNQNHAVHVVIERDALAAAGEVEVDDTMAEISAHGAGVFPSSQVLERFNDPMDYGRFSSACGVHVYGGDSLPPEYRGNLISCEPVSNLVHRDALAPAGATYTARRVDPDSELLSSSDHWFRPVNAETGPDGALYIVDMYRQVIEHPEWIPAHIQKLLDLKGGMDRGRIWRLTGGPIRRRKPELGMASAKELAVNLAHPNAWRRQTAQRLLVEGRFEEAADEVKAFLEDRPGPLGVLHALWTLDGLGTLEPAFLEDALAHTQPAVRAQAARLCARRGLPLAGLARLADDADPHVRFQAALALRALPPGAREPALRRIARLDAADPWMRSAVLLASGDFPGLAAAALEGELDGGREALLLAALRAAGRSGRASERGRALALVLDARTGDRLPVWQTSALSVLLEALGDSGLEEALRAVPANEAARLRDALRALLARVAERARDETADLAGRIAAVELAARDGSEATAALLASFLAPRYPADLQVAAVRGLAGAAHPGAAAALLEALPRLSPRVRGPALDAFLREEARALALLTALRDGAIAAGDIDLPRRKALLEHPAAAVRQQAATLLEALAASPDRAAVVDRYRAAIAALEPAAAADPARGETLYQKLCSVCHRHGDAGHPVGPDLTAMRQREPDALLADILDPNRAVAPEFVAYACVRTDGQVATGVLVAETPGSVVLRGQEGKSESILRRDIAQLTSSGKSLMPEGLEQELDPAQLRDVIAFVRGGVPAVDPRRLRAALTFHASFDGSADADFARGDRRAHTGGLLGKDARPGLTTEKAAIVKGKGRFGEALAWTSVDEQIVQYRGQGNIAYLPRDWSGTVSFWMSLDPDKDLPPAYSDPLNITERAWNDGAFFIDFSKDDAPRHLRLGAFADRAVWDPGQREWEQVPAAERPMVDVARPPFSGERWTHVAFTWSGFNSGRDDGAARLYLDGQLQGALAGRRQTFTWDPQRVWIHIGISYVGRLDDLAIFDRALTEAEVGALYRLPGGIASLPSP